MTFVNRQAGSGTRVLLDYYLQKEGLNPHRIKGYGNDEYIHTAVAVQVLSGGADCGLGILAAAQTLLAVLALVGGASGGKLRNSGHRAG